ncbi:class I SAM-dependent methyltransferase [Burkholderia cenocepacia]|uniref:class I SAM-dependent methyltransferase n=1 Tax=Burkholderia cenocepacia TaxID=95486 RepID=UPI001CF23085|nr:class I SAM-dependent methyltransferase [Burkholderia cenocepacia]MCA7962490.1 class I SAM-dependent methyltransferase [Burkholderia cenocepacia]
MRPSKLVHYLAEPGTGEPIELVVTETSQGEPFRGWLATRPGKIVGRLNEFKFDFVHFGTPPDIASIRADGQKETAPRPQRRFIDPRDARFQYVGKWEDIGDYLRFTNGNDPISCVTIASSALRIDIQLHAHQWSGIAAVFVNGDFHSRVDLFNQENSLPRLVRIENPAPGRQMVISVRPTGGHNPASYSTQLLIEGAIEYLDDLERPRYQKMGTRNHGGAPIEHVFYKYFNTLSPDAIALDIGGGKRQIDDERYINLEYSQYEEPDMFGDGQNLPFKTESIDFVYCTGVLEHVPDAPRAAREIHRVMKRGGKLVACIPFLQPLHNDPQHFFNATPFGVETLFHQFPDKHIWWGGAFDGIVKWIGEAAHLDRKADPADWDEFLRLAAKLAPHVGYDRLKFIASTVWVEATKT